MFARHRDALARLGVDTPEKFAKVIHAAQSKRSSDSIKRLYARQSRGA